MFTRRMSVKTYPKTGVTISYKTRETKEHIGKLMTDRMQIHYRPVNNM
jgi:hypothetical protein